VGPYEDLGGAYRALTEWIDRNGLEVAGPVQERYLNGPGDLVSPAEYRTEVEIPIIRTAVAIPA
jgi:effector-binding domain-containing protein